jgi:hypothetical protein
VTLTLFWHWCATLGVKGSALLLPRSLCGNVAGNGIGWNGGILANKHWNDGIWTTIGILDVSDAVSEALWLQEHEIAEQLPRSIAGAESTQRVLD